MEIKYNDTFSTSHSSDDVFDFIEKDATLLNGPRNEVTLFPKPTVVSLNETLYSGYKPQNIQLAEPESSLIKGSSIEIKPILLSDPDVNAQAAFAKSHTRDFYKGRSFRYAGKWEEGVHYINDEYITDFVVKDGVFLVCKKSNMSSWSNEPTEWVYEGDQIIAVISDYWEVVLAGGLRGKTYIPEYDSNSDSLIWRLVNPENLPQEFQTYLGIKGYIDYSLVPIQEEIIDIKSEADITKRNVNAIEGEIINLSGDISTLEIITGSISTHVEDLEGNFSEFVQTAEGFFYKVGDLENNVGQLWLTSQQFDVQLENAEGDISRLTIQADQISTRVENAEGDISQINQRADEISTQVENQQGDISRISQKADQIQSEVENQQGDISRITQRADIIESQVQNLNGDISTISQRADQIQSQVENIEGDISTITQRADLIEAQVQNIDGDISIISQRADSIELEVLNQQGDISQIRQTSSEIATEVAANKTDADNKYIETNSRITQTAAAINLEVSRVEGKTDASKSNIEILADSIVQQTLTYEYDQNGLMTNDTKSAITSGMNDISLAITGSKLETVGIFIRNASVNDNYINLIADKVRIKGTGDHTPTALGIYWDSTSQSYKISAANLQVEGAFSTTAWTDATTGQRKLVLDDAATAATGPTGYLTEALYGPGGSAASPTGGVYGTINPMTAALSNFTTITGGLILSTELILGQQSGQTWIPWAGMSGAYDSSSGSENWGHGIAAWYGGDCIDKARLSDAQIEQGWSIYRWARSLFRMDGSGYLADNNIWWGASGELHIGANTIIGNSGSMTFSQLANTVAELASYFEVVEVPSGASYTPYLKLKGSGTGFKGFVVDGFISAGGLSSGSGQSAGNANLSNVISLTIGQKGTISANGVGNLVVYDKDAIDAMIASAGTIQSVSLNAGSSNGTLHLTINGISSSDVEVTGLADSAYRTVASSIGSSITGLISGSLLQSILGNETWDSTNTVKAFVNSSIATATATYRGNYNEYSDLGGLTPTASHSEVAAALATKMTQLSILPDDNDYCFVEIPTSTSDPAQIERTERYKFDGTGWEYEYTLNNSGFTAAQWAAINSGVTDARVSTYDTVAGYFDANEKIATSHLPNMYIGTTQIRTTSEQQDVTGLGQVTMGYQKYLRMLDDGNNAVNVMRTTVSNSVLYLQIGNGLAGRADAATNIYGGREVRITTGRSTSTTHLGLTENDQGVKGAILHGNLVMDNAAYLSLYNNPASGAASATVSVMRLTTGNEFHIGEGTIAKGYATKVYGSPFYVLTGSGSSSPIRLQVTADGVIKPYGDIVPNSPDTYDLGSSSAFFAEAYTKKVYLAADTYLEVDSNGYVHLNTPSDKGFYCDGFVSAGGISPGAGSSGIDALAMWKLLTNNASLSSYDDNTKIAAAHIPDIAGTYGYLKVSSLSVTGGSAETGKYISAISYSNGVFTVSKASLPSSGVTDVTVGGSGHTDELAITKGGTTSYLTVPYATNVVRFKKYTGTAEDHGYDLNTLLSGGGITSQYTSTYYWSNGPTDMSYGGVLQINPNVGDSLAMQLAWDVKHSAGETGKIWWRDRNSTSGWGGWHLIYDDTSLTKAVITGLLDDGNGTYVKLNPGSAEQTISSNISSLDKGVVNLWRKSGNHFTFLGFSNGTTETYLGGIGFKSQFDHNLYRKYGSNYYKIWDEANSNLSSVDWACKDLSVAGNITLENNKFIRWMSVPAAGASPEAITAIEFTTGNNLYIGYGVAVSGHNTRLYGNSIDFLTGSTTRTNAFVLSDSNATLYRTFVPSINNRYDLGSSELKWGTLYANNGNFYSKVNVGAPSSTTAAVNVAGTIWASTGIWSDGYVSAGGLSTSSDARLKANIKDFGYSTALLMAIKPREWDWNGKTPMRGHTAGFIAQEIEPLLPYAVTERTYKQMTYDIFHALEVAGLQDHEFRLQTAECRIAILEKENAELRTRLINKN